MAEFKKQVAPRSQKMIKKRVLHNFIIRRNGDEFDEAKVWFGLNAIKVRDSARTHQWGTTRRTPSVAR